MRDDVAIACPTTFPRWDDYLGVWAFEPSRFRSLWDRTRGLDLVAHVAAHGRPVAFDDGPGRRPAAAAGYEVTSARGRNVAVIRATGTLMKQASSFGGTSTVQLRRDIRAAVSDPEVSGILLVIDSPGGTVSGTDDLATEVRRAGKSKPVWAHVDDLAASAAYWVASQSAKVFANSPTAYVGSIGTLMVIYDLSGLAEKDGVKTLVFATGPLKGAGVDGAPVTEEQAGYFQGIVNTAQVSFDSAVRSGRALTDRQLSAVRTGGVWGAEEAIDKKLIDGIQPLGETVDQLAAAAKDGERARRAQVSGVTIGGPIMATTFDEYCGARGIDPATLSADHLAAVRADFAAAGRAADFGRPVPMSELGANGNGAAELLTGAGLPRGRMMDLPAGVTVTAADGPGARMFADAAEASARIADIRDVFAGRHPRLEAAALRERWDRTRCELELLRADRPAAPNGFARDPDPAAGEVIETALCLAAGIPERAVAASVPSDRRERVMNEAARGKYRDYSLHALMDHTIHAAGGHYTGNRKSDDFIRSAFRADKLLASQGFSTVSLSGILGNVAAKAMIARYEAIAVVWPNFCAVRNQTDFKVWARYRLDANGAFRKIGPDGEIKHIQLTESPYTNQLGTYAAMIALTRQMMINDDLGAFTQIPGVLGELAAIRVEEAVHVLLLSNPNNFFSAGNNNLTTGAGSALSITSLGTAEQKFSDQVSPSGKPILNRPAVLLVPTTLSVPAQDLFKWPTVNETPPAGVRNPSGNPYVGKYPPVSDTYLNNTSIRDQDGQALSGQSGTAWYLFADPAVRAAFGVAFLNGQRTPTIESAETSFDTLGMQWRAWSDFGVGQEDPAAGQKMAGA